VQCVKVHKFWESQTKFQKINHFGFHRLEFLLQFEIGMGQYVFDHFITKTIQKKRLAFKSVKKWAILFINSVTFLK